ncbi:MAG: sterol desaturase family protein [Pseudomonadota bacterium]
MNNVSLLNIASLIPFSAFLLFLLLQYLRPRRDLARSGINRILHNLFLFVVNTLVMRLLVPITLIACSEWAYVREVGLFNMLYLSPWIVVPVCVVFMDFAIYWQHVATHKFAWLWRLHKVHHADHDMDVTTAIRFHPFELILSMIYKGTLVILLGIPLVAVVLFELLLFVGPAFNHSNLKLPGWLDRSLRWVIATPDMHRVHHSVIVAEQNTNYGFFLVWWDKLFNTYTRQPASEHTDMAIGLENGERDCERVDQMLVAPFR